MTFESIYEVFMDEAPSEDWLTPRRKLSTGAFLRQILALPRYRVSNSYFPIDYYDPDRTSNLPLTGVHVQAIYNGLLGQTWVEADCTAQARKLGTTRALRGELLRTTEFTDKYFTDQQEIHRELSKTLKAPEDLSGFSKTLGKGGFAEIFDKATDLTRIVHESAYVARRVARTQRKLEKFKALEKTKIAIVTRRNYVGIPEACLASELVHIRSFPISADLDFDALRRFDMVLVGNTLVQPSMLPDWRALFSGSESPIGVFWNHDNHHSFDESLRKTSCFDVVVPGHPNYTDYLLASGATLLSFVPCGVGQWSPDFISRNYHRWEQLPRSEELDGGFVLYSNRNGYRNRLIKALSEADFPCVVRGQVFGVDSYRKNDSEENFKEWMSYKCSIAIPVNNDMPIRIFDALATGQIPVVPAWLDGLDHVISLEDQEKLPIIKYYDSSLASIRAAHALAIRLFDEGGPEGARARSNYAISTHMRVHRYRDILNKTLQLVFLNGKTTFITNSGKA